MAVELTLVACASLVKAQLACRAPRAVPKEHGPAEVPEHVRVCLAAVSMHSMPQDSIAFITDIDISFPADILQRVRRYVLRGVRVFNPIVYYKCDNAGSAQCWEVSSLLAVRSSATERLGGWRPWDCGAVCVGCDVLRRV